MNNRDASAICTERELDITAPFRRVSLGCQNALGLRCERPDLYFLIAMREQGKTFRVKEQGVALG